MRQIDPWTGPIPEDYNEQKAIILASAQQYQMNSEFIAALEKEKLSAGEVIAAVQRFWHGDTSSRARYVQTIRFTSGCTQFLCSLPVFMRAMAFGHF